jgi:hypothetical protein
MDKLIIKGAREAAIQFVTLKFALGLRAPSER